MADGQHTAQLNVNRVAALEIYLPSSFGMESDDSRKSGCKPMTGIAEDV
jgi:hypothetical protein